MQAHGSLLPVSPFSRRIFSWVQNDRETKNKKQKMETKTINFKNAPCQNENEKSKTKGNLLSHANEMLALTVGIVEETQTQQCVHVPLLYYMNSGYAETHSHHIVQFGKTI